MTVAADSRAHSHARMNAMRLLVGGDVASRAAGADITANGQWNEVVELCGRWKLSPGLETRVTELQIQLPPAERAALGVRTSGAFIQSSLCIRAGANALAALEGSGVPCTGFKGLATLAWLYRGPRDRMLQDVDVLIQPADAERALAVLEENGFVRTIGGDWADYLMFIRHSPGSAGNEAVSVKDPQGGVVDLHWRVGSMDTARLLAEVQHATVLNRAVPVVSPRHGMLLTVHHAMRNDLVPDDVARDICDFARWQQLLRDAGDADAALAEASRWGLAEGCLAFSSIVGTLQNAQPQLDATTRFRGAAARVRQLADLYHYQLLHGPLNTDLAYLASSRPLRQILAGAVSGWSKYRASMRQSEEHNGETLPIGERVWRLARCAVRLSPAQWRQVRALAKTKDLVAGRGIGRIRAGRHGAP